MEKLISVLITAIMLISFATAVSAESDASIVGEIDSLYSTYLSTPVNSDDGYLYDSENQICYLIKEDGTVEISAYFGEQKAVSVPAAIDGRAVTSIGNAAFADGTFGDYGETKTGVLESVIIPDGITEIGEAAFYRQNSLKTVILPDTLEKIGGYAFQWCEISEINIPEKVTRIEAGTFAFTKLSEIKLPQNIDYIGGLSFYGIHTDLQPLNVNILNSDCEIDKYAFAAAEDELYREGHDNIYYGAPDSATINYAKNYGWNYKYLLTGDINNDGVANSKDVLALRKHIAKITPAECEHNADVNSDGVINGKDVLAMRKFFANITSDFNQE